MSAQKNVLQVNTYPVQKIDIYELDEYGREIYESIKEKLSIHDIARDEQDIIMSMIADSILETFAMDTIAPFFDTRLEENIFRKYSARLNDLAQKLNLKTFADIVSYESAKSVIEAYRQKISSRLPKNLKASLEFFMQRNNLTFGMGITVSDVAVASQEKLYRLLQIPFDLNDPIHLRAMKEFGIDNTGGIYTKLCDAGISNFQALLKRYESLDEIDIRGFGPMAKQRLQRHMKKNNISFGMEGKKVEE